MAGSLDHRHAMVGRSRRSLLLDGMVVTMAYARVVVSRALSGLKAAVTRSAVQTLITSPYHFRCELVTLASVLIVLVIFLLLSPLR